MKVKDLCTKNIRTCTKNDNLATVGSLMWVGDFGIVPVVDEDGRVAGVVTDRDIAIALATKNRPASEVAVAELPTETLHACSPDDDVLTALELMSRHRIRRLPVIGAGGRLYGMVSLNDVVLAANGKGADLPSAKAVIDTFKSICRHREPARAR